MLSQRIISTRNFLKLTQSCNQYSSLFNSLYQRRRSTVQISSHLDTLRRFNGINNLKCLSTQTATNSEEGLLKEKVKRDKHWIGDDLYEGNEIDTSSNRYRFRITPVNPSILSYIEKIGVGLEKRGNKARKRRALLLNENVKENVTPPPPFASTGQSHTVSKWRQYTIERVPVKALNIYDVEEDSTMPEIALAGRSNVGKSTLLNALLYTNIPKDKYKSDDGKTLTKKQLKNKLQLAKGAKALVSPRPGETRNIVTYELTNKLTPSKDESHKSLIASLRLVDLPGYGFAYANEEKAKEWRGAMKNYILHRGKNLKRILLLIDSRHGMKNTDVEFLGMIQDDFKEMERVQKKKNLLPHIQIVLTKCDLMKQADLARRVTIVKNQLSEVFAREPGKLPVMLVSGQAGLSFKNPKILGKSGMLELQRELASLVVYK